MKFRVGDKVTFTSRLFDQWKYICIGDVGTVTTTILIDGIFPAYNVVVNSNSVSYNIICQENIIEKYRR